MILDDQLPELQAYRVLERKFPIVAEAHLARLVVPSTAGETPIHRWFKFKEGFSPDLISTIVDEFVDRSSVTLLDPFCGGGTSLLAAQELSASGRDISAMGIERNPFIAFVARTKLSWPHIDHRRLLQRGAAAIRRSHRQPQPIPTLSSLLTGRCMSRYMSSRILAVAAAIRSEVSGPERDVLLLGLSACIEPMSRTRRDGRALRLVDKPPQRLSALLLGEWAQIAADIELRQRTRSRIRGDFLVLEGDGRNPKASGVTPGSVDVIVTSPPYPNNIDYSEVYKLELWLLGHVTSADAFLELRRTTFRSHPTCAPAAENAAYESSVRHGELAPSVGRLRLRLRRAKEHQRLKVLDGYCSDLWTALTAHYTSLRRGGIAAYVVGNSLHGSSSSSPYVIATDLLLAEMGSSLGFRVERVGIARSLTRRISGNHFLRESLVVLRK